MTERPYEIGDRVWVSVDDYGGSRPGVVLAVGIDILGVVLDDGERVLVDKDKVTHYP